MDVCVCNDGTSEVKGLLAGPVNGSPYFAALSSITGSSNIINTTLNPGSICQNLTSHRRKPSALLFTYFSSQGQLRIPEWTDWWTIEDTQPHAAYDIHRVAGQTRPAFSLHRAELHVSGTQ
jgi:hypothetical protein